MLHRRLLLTGLLLASGLGAYGAAEVAAYSPPGTTKVVRM